MPSLPLVSRTEKLHTEITLNAKTTAMFVYDIILTFPQEVEKIWRRKFTGLTVLWFMVSNFAVATLLVLLNNSARIDGYIYSRSLLYMMVRTQ